MASHPFFILYFQNCLPLTKTNVTQQCTFSHTISAKMAEDEQLAFFLHYIRWRLM